MQVIDILRESWDLGQTFVQGVQVALVIGFLVTVGVAAFASHRSTRVVGRPTGHPLLTAGGWGLAGLLVVSLVFSVRSSNRTAWARTEAIPEANRLVEAGDYRAGLALAEEASRYLDDDPALAEVFDASSVVLSVTSEPAGADVWFKEYAAPVDQWQHVGRTPVAALRMPLGPKLWRIEKAGFEAVRRAPPLMSDLHVVLPSAESVPAGMVPVPAAPTIGWTAETGANLVVSLPDFFYDRYEVTDRDFLAFVESGAYVDVDIWTELAPATRLPRAVRDGAEAHVRPPRHGS